MELQQQRGESTQNPLSKTTDNLGNNTMMLVDGNTYVNTGVANKENSSSSVITLQSYMQQDGAAGSSQRDDGTQIWHQNGQKVNNAFTPISMEGMYAGGGQHLGGGAPQMVYAVDMTDYSYSTRPAAAAACQPFYQYGYAAGNQQTPAYTNTHVYQNPQVGYAASMAPAQITPYNPGNHYSNNSSYVHPPPLQQQQQSKNSSYSGSTQPQQQQRIGGPVSNNSYMQIGHTQNNRNSYYTANPYVQQQHPVGQSLNNAVGGENNVGGTVPDRQASKTVPQHQKGTTKTPKLSSVFDNSSDNYTASWVSSTSSIPPDLKISPDHISNSGGTPVEYPANCWNSEQGQNAAAHNQLQQSASVDEFAAGASATSGFSPPNAPHETAAMEQQMGRVNLNHYGQKYASTSAATRAPTNFHKHHQQQPLRYVHPQSHQAKYNNSANNTSNSGNTPRQPSGNNTMPGGNMYASEYPQPPTHVNHPAAQSITQMPGSDAVSWADVLKRNGNCSSGETRFCATNNNANFNAGNVDNSNKRQSGGNGRRGEEMNGMHRTNNYTYGPNSLHSAAIKANSLHDSGYTSSSIQQQNQQGNRFSNTSNTNNTRRNFGKPPPRYGNPASEPSKTTTILPAQAPNFINGQFSAVSTGTNFPIYAAQQPSYVPNNRYVFNPAGPPQNIYQGGMHASSQADKQMHKLDSNGVATAFNPPATYLRSPIPIPSTFLPHPMAPSFVQGMPPFFQIPPQFARNSLGVQDEKFKNTWLDQAKPINQVFNERTLGVYVTYHNNAVVVTRNSAKENGNLPYYGSLLSTALQCMQNSNAVGFNNHSNNKKPNISGDKLYLKDKKRAFEAGKEEKDDRKSPPGEGAEDTEPSKKGIEVKENEESQSEPAPRADRQSSVELQAEIPAETGIVVRSDVETTPAAVDSKQNKEVESTKEEAAEKKD